jgi:hypothetical protein
MPRIGQNFLLAAPLSVVACLTDFVAAATDCSADLDGSGVVNGLDLASLLAEWGRCDDCPADLDGSGVVNGLDLATLLAAWGPLPIFSYGEALPDQEAEQIALEMLGPQGPLQPPAASYERVDRDLDLIRAAYPQLADQTHTPAWAPSHLIVSVFDNQPTDELDCLNGFYGVTEVDKLFSFGGTTWYVLTYPGNLNVEALAVQYAALLEVSVAEPDSLLGGQNKWEPTPMAGGVWQWFVDDGFWDCFDGCDCHTHYTFTVDEKGTVTLVDSKQFGQPWCDF